MRLIEAVDDGSYLLVYAKAMMMTLMMMFMKVLKVLTKAVSYYYCDADYDDNDDDNESVEGVDEGRQR